MAERGGIGIGGKTAAAEVGVLAVAMVILTVTMVLLAAEIVVVATATVAVAAPTTLVEEVAVTEAAATCPGLGQVTEHPNAVMAVV